MRKPDEAGVIDALFGSLARMLGFTIQKPTPAVRRPRLAILAEDYVHTRNSGAKAHRVLRVQIIPRSKYDPVREISKRLNRAEVRDAA